MCCGKFRKIGIVIPVYNESSTISLLINEIKSSDYLKNEFSSFEILVVDDGSEDETPTILKKCNEFQLLHMDTTWELELL